MMVIFEVISHIGVISYGTKGWRTELNLVSWNGREPKYDIRDWDANRQKMGRGISFSKQELLALMPFILKISNEE